MSRKPFAICIVCLAISVLLACVATSIGCQQDPKKDGREAAEDVTLQDDSNSGGGSDSQDAGGGIIAASSTEAGGGQSGSSSAADTTPPVVSGIAAIDITSISAKITWNTDEPATSLVEYGLTSSYGYSSIADAALVDSHSVVLGGLTSGTTYHFRVTSRDASGNGAISDDSTFTLPDITPPAISKVAATNITQNGVRIIWNTDESATSQVEYGLTSSYGSTSSDANMVTSHNVALSGLTSNATYHFRVRSGDASGNGVISDDSTFTLPDTTPPVISNVAATNITQNSAKITWKTDESATSQVDYGLTSSYGSTSSDASLVTSHSVSLSGLTSSATYHFRVRSKDASGNEAVSSNATFTTSETSSDGFNRAIITLVFDDGYEDTYTYALPALNSYGFKSTQYIISGSVDTSDYVTTAELWEYVNTGHEIASHTVTHPHLTQVSASKLQTELSNSKTFLQQFGTITDFATPYGEYNDSVIAAIKNYYQSHRGVDEGYNTKADFDIYNILVQNMINTTTLSEVQTWIENAKAGHYWLVLVYHQVGPSPRGTWYTQLDDFLAQLDLISTEGIAVETMRDALAEILPQLS